MRKGDKVLDIGGRYKLGKLMAVRYKNARKKERGEILDRFTEATGYNRCYGGWLLRNWGRKVVVYNKGKRTVLIGERKERQKGIRRRTIYYDKEVLDVLKHIWLVLDCPCGKRLAPYLREVVRVLEREGK